MDWMEKPKFSQLWPQWIATFEVFLMKMATGIALGWLPPFLGLLRTPNSPYEATKDEISWVAALVGFAKPLGVIAGALATTYFGAKRAMNISVIFLLIGWTCLIFADRIEVVYITFICKGLNLGSSTAIYPVYIAEISDANIRGTLISFISQGLMAGLLFGNLMGTHLTPQVYAIIGIWVVILFLVTFLFLPQTPHHLIRCNRMEEAARSMKWYNRKRNTTKQLVDLVKFLDSNPKLPFFLTLRATFQNPVNRRTLLKFFIMIFTLQVSGLLAMEEFMVIIFADAQVTALKPTTVMALLSLINIPASWIPIYIIDKYKRTNIYLLASIAAAVSMVGFGLTYTLSDSGSSGISTQWIIIMSAIIFRISITIGPMPIFVIFMGELFAPNVKTVSITILLILNGILTFLSHKYFMFFVELLTYKSIFFAAAVIVIIHGIYVKTCMPETKGKSLQEIQRMLNENRNEDWNSNSTVHSRLI